MQRHPAFFGIEPGALCTCENRVYRIKGLLADSRILAVDLQTQESATLEISKINGLNDRMPDGKFSERPDLTSYSEEDWAVAQRRFQIIKPFLRDADLVPPMEEWLKKHNVSQATFYRWLKAYAQSGHVSSLVPATQGRKVGKRLLSPDQEAIITRAIEDVYLQIQRGTPADVVRVVLRNCRKSGVRPPGVGAIRARVAAIPERVSMRARGQREQARNKYSPIRDSFPGGTFP